jgi:hypothetical protein
MEGHSHSLRVGTERLVNIYGIEEVARARWVVTLDSHYQVTQRIVNESPVALHALDCGSATPVTMVMRVRVLSGAQDDGCK